MPKLELSVGWHLETGSTRAIKSIKAKLNLKGGGAKSIGLMST